MTGWPAFSRSLRLGLGILTLWGATLVAACAPLQDRSLPGGPARSSTSAGELGQVEEAERAIKQKLAELRAAHVEAVPDCARVCLLQDNICALAGRICAIAARYPSGDPLAGRCADARARCHDARREASARCACSARTE